MRVLVTLLSGALLFLPLSALATEIPGGPVYGDWYSSGNPYNVNGDINVPVDSTLYIHEGVEVIFQADYRLQVNGFLEAVGTESDSILFTASTTWGGITFTNAPDSSHLAYCTITGCQIGYGAAIYCINSNPVITDCTIRNNSGSFYGGVLLENSNSLISNCTIRDNQGYRYYGSGITLLNSSAEISYCSITGNGHTNSVGSGIYCSTGGCTPLISHCSITGNEGIRGGGVFVDAGANPVISNSTISENIAWNGGGIYFSDGSSGTITNCIINADSTIDEDNTKGGGILISSSSGVFTISNSTISNCWSRFGGSGVHIDDADSVSITGATFDANACADEEGAIYSRDCGSLVIDHCDLVRNRGGLLAGGIRLEGNTNLTLTNCVFRSQSECDIVFWSYTSASVSYSDFYGCGTGHPFGGWPPAGLGELVQVNANGDSCDVYYNIFLNPVLVGLYNHDYNLRWRSPCIDAGDPDSPLDPDNTVCDMGRYYFNQDALGVVELYPHEARIVIPPGGGQLVYDGWVFNFTGHPGRADIWTYAFVPGVGRYGPIDLYRNFRIPPDSIGRNDIHQNVPGLAPQGDYTFVAYVGRYPSTIIDSSYFYFSKSGSAGGGITGWFEGDQWLKGGHLAESNLPSAYALSQNYPNPFNAATTIHYQLPADTEVKLEVYNTLGQKVATLVDSKQQSGYRSVVWGASAVSSGLYFYRLTAGDYTETKRMMLVK